MYVESDETDESVLTSPNAIEKDNASISSTSITSEHFECTDSSPSKSPLKRRTRNPSRKLSKETLRRQLKYFESEDEDELEDDGSVNNHICDAVTQIRVPEAIEKNIHGNEVTGGDSDNVTENVSLQSDNDPVNCSRESETNSDISVRSMNAESVSSGQPISSEEDEGDVDSDNDNILTLYEGSDMGSTEALYEILKLYVEEKWTKTSLNKNIELMKYMLPKPNHMPSSGRDALIQLENMTTSFKEAAHFYCVKCMKLCNTNLRRACDACNTDQLSTFFTFPIEDQIKFFFEHRDMGTLIENYTDERGEGVDLIRDIQDGSEYKRIKMHLLGQYDLIILWNTDGVSLSKSSKQELWPIFATICELPPRVRSSFMIICGVVVCSSRKTIDMNLYLKPFVDNLISINNIGGVSWIHPQTKATHHSLICAPALSADAPAKAKVLKCKQHNSMYACNICEQKSKKIATAIDDDNYGGAEGQLRKRKRRVRRFLFEEDTRPARLRTGARMDAQGRLAEEEGESRKGVNGKAIISNIPYLDRANCVCAEYMHLILLGVTHQFLSLIFFKPGPWHVGKKINDIDNFISEIKVPDFIKRRPRQLDDFKWWKASELRSFLLFYSLPIFKQVLECRYFDHWILLVAAMHILLSNAISVTDLETADILLKAFVRDVGQLYGEACYTYNVHTLLHVCVLVKRWGNLQSTSAFPFETYNGFIASHIHGTKIFGQEFINNVKIIQRVAILGNIVKNSDNSSQRVFDDLGTTLLGKLSISICYRTKQ